MVKLRFGAVLTLAAVSMLVGCHSGQVRQAQEPSSQVAYDPALGVQTLEHNGIIYQTVGQPMEGSESDLVAVGMAEGFVLYQLAGGGAGTAERNLLFIQTKDGKFQALQAIGSTDMPHERQQQQAPTMPDEHMP